MILKFLENNLLDNYYSQKIIFLTVFKECNEDCKQFFYERIISLKAICGFLLLSDAFMHLRIRGIGRSENPGGGKYSGLSQ